jgi:hypothetical protein
MSNEEIAKRHLVRGTADIVAGYNFQQFKR